jgi:NADH:ubiquinone oxidoreductase subunit F (NADH-binding)
VGTAQMHDMLARITRGDGLAEDMSLLQDLADVMKSTSLCGLGQSSPNPVLTTMRYFKDEYLAHIHDKRCPAGSCPIHTSKPSLEEAVR